MEELLLESVRISGATTLNSNFHKFSPHGVSGVVVISESHFSIHTWPEYGYCALDIFTCGDEIKSDLALEYLKRELEVGNISMIEVKRGILDFPVKLYLDNESAQANPFVPSSGVPIYPRSICMQCVSMCCVALPHSG